MKKSIIIAAVGLQGLIANAQSTVASGNGQVFQFNTVTAAQGNIKLRTVVGMPAKTVTGRPVSATEERHTLQILGDGTRIESTDTDKFYRDDQGRTRTERADGTVLINDPVLGTSAEINGERTMVHHTSKSETAAVLRQEVSAQLDVQLDKMKLDKLMAEASAKAQTTAATNTEEDLGYQSINGVTAQGFRTTTTIPAAKIGNDRPIQIVSERWYAPDLQMNVKTTNSDPRFGDTTYQLTNIVQAAPDPALFQMPAESK